MATKVHFITYYNTKKVIEFLEEVITKLGYTPYEHNYYTKDQAIVMSKETDKDIPKVLLVYNYDNGDILVTCDPLKEKIVVNVIEKLANPWKYKGVCLVP